MASESRLLWLTGISGAGLFCTDRLLVRLAVDFWCRAASGLGKLKWWAETSTRKRFIISMVCANCCGCWCACHSTRCRTSKRLVAAEDLGRWKENWSTRLLKITKHVPEPYLNCKPTSLGRLKVTRSDMNHGNVETQPGRHRVRFTPLPRTWT